MKTGNTEVVLLHSRSRRVGIRSYLNLGYRVYYLDADVALFCRNHHIEPDAISTFTPEFHSTLKEHKEDYLAFIDQELTSQLPDDIRWIPQLSSRNAVSAPFLTEATLLALSLRKATEGSRVLLASQNTRLLMAIADNMYERSINYRWLGRISAHMDYFKLIAARVIFPCVFFIKTLGLGRLLRNTVPKLAKDSPYTILRTWINLSSFDSNLAFHNRNFGPLQSFLESHQRNVCIWPMFFAVNRLRDYRTIMKGLKLHNLEVFCFADQLSLKDYCAHLIRYLKLSLRRYRPQPFKGMNVSRLLQGTATTCNLSFDHFLLTLADYQLRNAVRSNIFVNKIIYPMENNVPELQLIDATRRNHHLTEILGYQNSAWFAEIGSMTIRKSEHLTRPLPHKIIVNGKRYLHVFNENGFPKNRLILGSNLRFDSRKYQTLLGLERKASTEDIFIMGNYSPQQTTQCILACNKLFAEIPGLTIQVKLHPLCTEKDITRRTGDLERFSVTSTSFDDLLERASLVLAPCGSVTNLEVAAAGIPLIRFSNANSLDLEPFWDEYSVFDLAHNADDVLRQYRKWQSFTRNDWEVVRDFGRTILSQYFEPQTKHGMKVFL